MSAAEFAVTVTSKDGATTTTTASGLAESWAAGIAASRARPGAHVTVRHVTGQTANGARRRR